MDNHTSDGRRGWRVAGMNRHNEQAEALAKLRELQEERFQVRKDDLKSDRVVVGLRAGATII